MGPQTPYFGPYLEPLLEGYMGPNHIDGRLGPQCIIAILGPYRGSRGPIWGCILRPLFEGSGEPPGPSQLDRLQIGPLFGASGPGGLKKGPQIGPI